MQKELTKNWDKIRDLGDEELITNVDLYYGNEQKVKTLNIARLAEIRKRKLHLDRGYGSLYDYCIIALNISEGSAWRRLQVAGICERLPEVLSFLYDGRLTLTNAAILSPHLNEENYLELLKEASGKTRRAV